MLEIEEDETFRIAFTGNTDESEPYSSTFFGTYTRLKPGEKIIHTDEFETEDTGMAGEMTVTVTFENVVVTPRPPLFKSSCRRM